MSLDSRVSALIKRVYSAGENREAWDDVAVELLQIMDCRAGVATLVELPTMELLSCRVYVPDATDIGGGDEYPDRYAEDPSLMWASINPHARFCDSRQIVPNDVHAAHPFVRWTKSKLDAVHWYSGFSSTDDEPTFFLSAYFSEESDERLAGAHNVFRTVFDHIECALRLGRQPSIVASARALLRLQPDGTIQHYSKGAETLLAQRGPLRISDGRLDASDSEDRRRLEEAIERACTATQAGARPTAVHLGHEGRPWIVVVRPIYESFGPFGKVCRQVQAEIFDRIPGVGRLDVVQSLFDLTGRELQVLRFLSEGHSIDSLSACLGVSRNTTRAHLRSIYAKTRTSSQAELMQLCAGLSAAASSDAAIDRRSLFNVN